MVGQCAALDVLAKECCKEYVFLKWFSFAFERARHQMLYTGECRIEISPHQQCYIDVICLMLQHSNLGYQLLEDPETENVFAVVINI